MHGSLSALLLSRSNKKKIALLQLRRVSRQRRRDVAATSHACTACTTNTNTTQIISSCTNKEEWNGAARIRPATRTSNDWYHRNQQHFHHYQYSKNGGWKNFHRAFSTTLAPPPPHHEDDEDETDSDNNQQHIVKPHDNTTPAARSPLEDDQSWLDEEIERLTASSYNIVEDEYEYGEDDANEQENDKTKVKVNQDQHERQQRLLMDHSSLDLELGETSVWDTPRSSSVPDVFEYLDDAVADPAQRMNEKEKQKQQQFPAFPKGSPAAELHRQEMKQRQLHPRKRQPILSPLDMLEQLDNKNDNNTTQPPRLPQADPLSYQGPYNNGVTTPCSSTAKDDGEKMDLRQIQLQLECEAQREAVLKYQKLTDQTRSRKDYGSLNSLQKLMLHWYQPVRDEIEQVQHEYIFKQKQQKDKDKKKQKSHKTSKDDKDNNTSSSTSPSATKNPALNKYGPLLNTVDPEKLAVIATHEALTTSILVSHESTNHNGGCPVVLLAQKLGQAVEEEVLLQRVLKQHMEEERVRQQEKEAASSSSSGSDQVTAFAKELLSPEAILPSDKDGGNDKETDTTKRFSYAEARLTSYLQKIAGDGAENASAKNRRNIAYAVRRARRLLNTDDWTIEDRVHVGSILLKILLDHATIRLPDGTYQPAFRMERRWHKSRHANNTLHNNNNKSNNNNATENKIENNFKSTNVIMVHDALLKLAVADEFESIAATTTRYKPMVIPPEPWTSPENGGYAWLKTDLIRFHGSEMQREALDQADMTTVFDGLNKLSREAWVINKKILEVAQECWDKNIPLGDIPNRTDLDVPPEPTPPERTTFASMDDAEVDEEHAKMQKQRWVKHYTAYKEALNRYRRVQQKNRDMFSLRCSAKLKLGQAEQFKDYENIYFPYNMDFRGRAYPVPPHFSNVGSDLCRGMLKFAKEKPLGKRGLFWLQVHLANLAGKDKMTFEDRAQHSIDNLENIRKSVDDPLGRSIHEAGERPWWMALDDPFQGLATCHEIINAIDSGDPETYMCSLPVHMDGSCNGLQHYAALGLDTVGGTAVNLCNFPEPQDVYIGVMEEVIRRVAEEAKRDLDFDDSELTGNEELTKEQKKELARNRSAKLVNGLIDRGVVKRTVMTSVYGVTYIGARQQIQEKIEEKLEEQGRDLDEINFEVFRASGYLAEVTMNVIGDLFTGAKQTMNWLTHCARLISSKGHPVAWMTPLGLPALQPYRQKRASRIITALSSLVVADHSDDLPIHKSRSVSAFPPNYIHSLDSTHMLMTALEMDRRGLSFSAVHDSFWTHPCDIDEMNEALRDAFVELYSQPLLEELKESFEMRYPDITFPDLPGKGDLDLDEVKESKFFFQ